MESRHGSGRDDVRENPLPHIRSVLCRPLDVHLPKMLNEMWAGAGLVASHKVHTAFVYLNEVWSIFLLVIYSVCSPAHRNFMFLQFFPTCWTEWLAHATVSWAFSSTDSHDVEMASGRYGGLAFAIWWKQTSTRNSCSIHLFVSAGGDVAATIVATATRTAAAAAAEWRSNAPCRYTSTLANESHLLLIKIC